MKKMDYPLLAFATLIALAIRMTPALEADFPLNDGGLFYAMISDLQAAHFSLPVFTTYNGANIPFAYPPLAFYVAGVLGTLFHISTLDLLRLLPPLVSTFNVPAFYLLARSIAPSKTQVMLSTLVFALLPRAFAWHIMGGGITRSLGLLFSLLTLTSAYQFYSNRQTHRVWTLVLLGALTVLTHPEATVHTVLGAFIFYLWKDRSWKGLLQSLVAVLGILILTAPWWGVVIARFDIDPFQAAMTASAQDSYNALEGLLFFFRFLFTDEAYLPIFASLGLIGLFASLAHKQTLLPGWLFIAHLVEPRGGTLYMMLPLSLLVGYSLEKVIFPALNQITPDRPPQETQQAYKTLLRNKPIRYFLLFLIFYGTLSAYNWSLRIKDILSLQPADLEAMNWVRENVLPGSQFVILTGNLPLRDATSEWFPVLTGRHSQATLFGYEWVNDGKFGQRVAAYNELQACRNQDVSCLEQWAKENGDIQYVYVWRQPNMTPPTIAVALANQSTTYQLVYQNAQVTIYSTRPNP